MGKARDPGFCTFSKLEPSVRKRTTAIDVGVGSGGFPYHSVVEESSGLRELLRDRIPHSVEVPRKTGFT
jgi:hypothetical protein